MAKKKHGVGNYFKLTKIGSNVQVFYQIGHMTLMDFKLVQKKIGSQSI